MSALRLGEHSVITLEKPDGSIQVNKVQVAINQNCSYTEIDFFLRTTPVLTTQTPGLIGGTWNCLAAVIQEASDGAREL